MDLIVSASAMIAYHATWWGIALQAFLTVTALLFLFTAAALANGSEGYVWLSLAMITWVATALRDWWLITYRRRDADYTTVDTRWCFSRGLNVIACILRLSMAISFFQWIVNDRVSAYNGGGFLITLAVMELIYGVCLVEVGRTLVVWWRREELFLADFMDAPFGAVQERTLALSLPPTSFRQWLAWIQPRRYFSTGIKAPIFHPVEESAPVAVLRSEDGKDPDTILL